MESIACPQCGGCQSQDLGNFQYKCEYCGSVFFIEQDYQESTNAETTKYCSCGRIGVAVCSVCKKTLCEKHIFKLSDFDLLSIGLDSKLFSNKNSIISERDSLLRSTGPDTIFCSKCFDKTIEDWISNL